MVDLVPTMTFGDIRFGAPPDIAVLNMPFGFYEFLGIPRDASEEEIRTAYRRAAKPLHSDHGGNDDQMRVLNDVVEVLLDKNNRLGPEFSKRKEYDTVCGYDEFFDGFIQLKEERTRKLSEIMLMRMQAQRSIAHFEHESEEFSPEYAAAKAKFERARSDEGKRKAAEKMQEILLGRVAARNSTTVEQVKKDIESAQRTMQEQGEKSVAQFRQDVRHGLGEIRIYDIFYVGGSQFTFGLYEHAVRMGIIHYARKGDIADLVLGQECYVAGIPQVHFKAREADVKIKDPNLTGMVHVVKGGVYLDYTESSYGNVIRARAPQVFALHGFVQRGDLFISESCACKDWWEKKPALDIAVMDGTVSLQLTNPKMYAGLGNRYLDSIISTGFFSEKKISDSIIIPNRYYDKIDDSYYKKYK